MKLNYKRVILVGMALFHALETVFRRIPPGEELCILRTALDEIFGEHAEEDRQCQSGHQNVDDRGEQGTFGDDDQKISKKPECEIADQKCSIELIAAVSTVHEAQNGILHFIEKITHGEFLDSKLISL